MTFLTDSLKKGISFGLTSGTITTLGLIVGLHSATIDGRNIILGGIITIAIADAFSDALGIHISEESEKHRTHKEVWEATIATFLAKFFYALTFLIPMLLITNTTTAITVSIIYGFSILSLLSYYIGKHDGGVWKSIAEHLAIATVVIIIAHYVGDIVRLIFGY